MFTHKHIFYRKLNKQTSVCLQIVNLTGLLLLSLIQACRFEHLKVVKWICNDEFKRNFVCEVASRFVYKLSCKKRLNRTYLGFFYCLEFFHQYLEYCIHGLLKEYGPISHIFRPEIIGPVSLYPRFWIMIFFLLFLLFARFISIVCKRRGSQLHSV